MNKIDIKDTHTRKNRWIKTLFFVFLCVAPLSVQSHDPSAPLVFEDITGVFGYELGEEIDPYYFAKGETVEGDYIIAFDPKNKPEYQKLIEFGNKTWNNYFWYVTPKTRKIAGIYYNSFHKSIYICNKRLERKIVPALAKKYGEFTEYDVDGKGKRFGIWQGNRGVHVGCEKRPDERYAIFILGFRDYDLLKLQAREIANLE